MSTSHQQRSESRLMYLDKTGWSRRYDSTFYTFEIAERQRCDQTPSSLPSQIRGKTNHPAYYYQVIIYRGPNTFKVWRRFSHFVWLYRTLMNDSLGTHEELQRIKLPPGTCPVWWQNDDFAATRQAALEEFLKDLLSCAGVPSHPAVLEFLELK